MEQEPSCNSGAAPLQRTDAHLPIIPARARLLLLAAGLAMLLATTASIVLSTVGLSGYSRVFLGGRAAPGEPLALRAMRVEQRSQQAEAPVAVQAWLAKPDGREIELGQAKEPGTIVALSFVLPRDYAARDELKLKLESASGTEWLQGGMARPGAAPASCLRGNPAVRGVLKGTKIADAPARVYPTGGRLLSGAAQVLFVLPVAGENSAAGMLPADLALQPTTLSLLRPGPASPLPVHFRSGAPAFLHLSERQTFAPARLQALASRSWFNDERPLLVTLRAYSRIDEVHLDVFNRHGWNWAKSARLKDGELLADLPAKVFAEGLHCVRASFFPFNPGQGRGESCFLIAANENQADALLWEALGQMGVNDPLLDEARRKEEEPDIVRNALLTRVTADDCPLPLWRDTHRERVARLSAVRDTWREILWWFILAAGLLMVALLAVAAQRQKGWVGGPVAIAPARGARFYLLAAIVLALTFVAGTLYLLRLLWWGIE